MRCGQAGAEKAFQTKGSGTRTCARSSTGNGTQSVRRRQPGCHLRQNWRDPYMTAVEMMTEDMESHSRAECARTKHLVVVATDGSEAALSAFAAAALIAEKCGSAVHVLTVLEPLPVLVPLSESVLIRPDIENNRAEGQRRKAQEQMAGFSGSETWRIETKFGRAADVIAQYGKDNHADLIIIGSHKH